MLHSGKCPKCEETVGSARVETIEIRAGAHDAYKGVSYLCPHCRSVLSVSIDQIALNADLVTRLLKALGRG
jgi:hypothetical protein